MVISLTISNRYTEVIHIWSKLMLISSEHFVFVGKVQPDEILSVFEDNGLVKMNVDLIELNTMD